MITASHAFGWTLVLPRGLRVGIACLAWLAGSPSARSCNVPVFRYALERWDSEDYVAVVAHDEPLTAAQKTVLGKLSGLSRENDGVANLSVQVIDVVAAPDAPAVGYLPLDQVSLPAVFLFYPAGFGQPTLIWSGGLSGDNVGMITGSPLRDKFVELAVKGTTATWVLMESGHPDEDDRSEQVLRESLTAMQQELELPQGVRTRSGEGAGGEGTAPDDNGYFDSVNQLESDIPLRIAFEVVRLAADDPREEVLRAMLMNVVPGLAAKGDKPMAFPLFGRGRMLAPLVGAEIRGDKVELASRYLCGPCSCQVKALNPGVDMLMNIDWEAKLVGGAGMGKRELPPLTGAGALVEGMPVDRSPAPCTDESLPEASQSGVSHLLRNLTLTIGVVILLLAAGTIAIMRRSGKPPSQ